MDRAEVMPWSTSLKSIPGTIKRPRPPSAGKTASSWNHGVLWPGEARWRNRFCAALRTKHNKSVAQICIRWVLQRGIVPLPKSAHKNRIRANLDVFDFSLDGEDMALIETMDAPGNYSIHPDYLSEE